MVWVKHWTDYLPNTEWMRYVLCQGRGFSCYAYLQYGWFESATSSYETAVSFFSFTSTYFTRLIWYVAWKFYCYSSQHGMDALRVMPRTWVFMLCLLAIWLVWIGHIFIWNCSLVFFIYFNIFHTSDLACCLKILLLLTRFKVCCFFSYFFFSNYLTIW